jgi:uncharacterized protein (UPF0297 family)
LEKNINCASIVIYVEKRGQLTVAIVIVVFVILILGVVMYFTSMMHEKGIETTTYKATTTTLDTNMIKSYVDSCVDQVTRKGLLTLGQHGGYLNPSGDPAYGESGCENYTSYNGSLICYYLIGDIIYVPELANLTERLRRYTAVELSNCLNFSYFYIREYKIYTPNIDYASIGFDFNQALTNYSLIPVNISVLANKDDVAFEITYPIRVNKKDARKDLVNFEQRVAAPLKALHQNATALVIDVVSNQPYDMSEHCDMYTAVSKILFINNTVIRLIADVSNAPYVLDFAIKDTQFSGECNP